MWSICEWWLVDNDVINSHGNLKTGAECKMSDVTWISYVKHPVMWSRTNGWFLWFPQRMFLTSLPGIPTSSLRQWHCSAGVGTWTYTGWLWLIRNFKKKSTKYVKKPWSLLIVCNQNFFFFFNLLHCYNSYLSGYIFPSIDSQCSGGPGFSNRWFHQ